MRRHLPGHTWLPSYEPEAHAVSHSLTRFTDVTVRLLDLSFSTNTFANAWGECIEVNVTMFGRTFLKPMCESFEEGCKRQILECSGGMCACECAKATDTVEAMCICGT